MMRKNLLAMIMAGLMLLPIVSVTTVSAGLIKSEQISSGFIKSQGVPSEYKEYTFENVIVSVKGRCRTIGSIGGWIGGLYKGHLTWAFASMCCPPGVIDKEEYFNVEIRNLIGILLCSASYYRGGKVEMTDAIGSFYWGRVGNGVDEHPPEIEISCWARGTVVIGVYEGQVKSTSSSPIQTTDRLQITNQLQ